MQHIAQWYAEGMGLFFPLKEAHFYPCLLRLSSSLRIAWEYQATTFSLYPFRLSSDQQQIDEVTNPRRLETHFRSPQLDLWQLSDTEWLLALRRPEPVARRNGTRSSLLHDNSCFPRLARLDESFLV